MGLYLAESITARFWRSARGGSSCTRRAHTKARHRRLPACSQKVLGDNLTRMQRYPCASSTVCTYSTRLVSMNRCALRLHRSKRAQTGCTAIVRTQVHIGATLSNRHTSMAFAFCRASLSRRICVAFPGGKSWRDGSSSHASVAGMGGRPSCQSGGNKTVVIIRRTAFFRQRFFQRFHHGTHWCRRCPVLRSAWRASCPPAILRGGTPGWAMRSA